MTMNSGTASILLSRPRVPSTMLAQSVARLPVICAASRPFRPKKQATSTNPPLNDSRAEKIGRRAARMPRGLRLVLDVGLRPVAAGRGLDMPVAVLVLVFDDFGMARLHLLGRRHLGGIARLRVRGEGFRIDAVDPVRPAAIVLDDLVSEVDHG